MKFDLADGAFALPFAAFVEEIYRLLESFDWVRDDDRVFHFVRALKGHSQTLGCAPEPVLATLRALAARRSNPVASGDFDLHSEDFEVAFHDAWGRVRFPLGTDPVDVACGLAEHGLLRTAKARPGRYARFLTVAALLQIQVRERCILLPVRKLAERLGCEPNTISAWVRWAIEDGVLVRTKAHAFRSSGDSRAAEYVFALHAWESGGIQKVADLLHVQVTAQDRAWTRRQFEGDEDLGSE